MTIGSKLASISDAAFEGCSALTTVLFPDNVTTIGDYAFNGCSSLKSLTFPNKLTSIGYMAFRWCNSLKSVSIPSSITSISDKAFENCKNLTFVTIGKNAPASINEDVFTNRKNAYLYVPTGSIENYQAANYWKEFKEIMDRVAPSPDLDLGDVNGDGKIDIDDAVYFIYHIVGIATPVFFHELADLNNDNAITITDATLVVSQKGLEYL